MKTITFHFSTFVCGGIEEYQEKRYATLTTLTIQYLLIYVLTFIQNLGF